MHPDRLKTLVQLTGVLIALMSHRFFLIGVPMLVKGNVWGMVTFLLGMYSLYVGYLAVMRFSPKAVRHVFGMFCFWLFILGRIPARAFPATEPYGKAGAGLASIVLIICAVWIYRRGTRFFIQKIFPQPPPIQSQ